MNPLQRKPQSKVKIVPLNVAMDKAITQLSAQTEELEAMQKTLDDQACLRWDLEDKNNTLTMRVMQLEAFLEGSKSNAAREAEILRQTEARYAEVVKQLQVTEKNLQHAKEAAAYQEKTVQLAKVEMEKIRASKVSDEHLARKLIELVEENRKLREDLVAQKMQEREALDIINNRETPAEIKKYQEQVTRLLQERVDYDCQVTKTSSSLCGGCLACQLQQAQHVLEQTAQNLKKANDERDVAKSNNDSKIKSLEDKVKLVVALDNELRQYKQLTTLLTDGLHQARTAGIFARKGVVETTLHAGMVHRKLNNMMP